MIEMLKRSEGVDAGAVWGCSKVVRVYPGFIKFLLLFGWLTYMVNSQPVPDGIMFSPLRATLAREGGKLLVSVLRDMIAGEVSVTNLFHFMLLMTRTKNPHNRPHPSPKHLPHLVLVPPQ